MHDANNDEGRWTNDVRPFVHLSRFVERVFLLLVEAACKIAYRTLDKYGAPLLRQLSWRPTMELYQNDKWTFFLSFWKIRLFPS